MSDDTSANVSAEVDPAESEQPEASAQDDGADALGDAGKQALDRMKAQRNEAKAAARAEKQAREALQAELERLRAGAQEDETDRRIREAETAALQKANQRIINAELRAAAAGKLADPADALRFIDVSAFEVDAEGNVDAEAIAEAIADLTQKKPYLSAQGGRRFGGTVDGGARDSRKPDPGPGLPRLLAAYEAATK